MCFKKRKEKIEYGTENTVESAGCLPGIHRAIGPVSQYHGYPAVVANNRSRRIRVQGHPWRKAWATRETISLKIFLKT